MDTLTLTPSEINELETSYGTEIVEFGNDVEQRTPSIRRARRSFVFRWNLISASDRTSLQNFFESQQGMFKSWLLTDGRMGSNDPVRLRFNEDKIKFEPVKHKAYNVQIKVITC